MEDSSPMIDSNSDDGIHTGAQFTEFFKLGLLSLDDHTVTQAMKHVFVSNIETSKSKVTCLFELHFRGLLQNVKLSSSDSESVNDARFYQVVFGEFFLPSDANLHAQSRSADGDLSKYFQFGWLLFLPLRVHKWADLSDFLTCTSMLISILAVLIIHIPCCFRIFNLDSPRFVKKSNKGINLLASLGNYYHTSEDDIRKSVQKVNSLIADSLKVKQCLASDFKKAILKNTETDDLVYFEDLLEEPFFSSRLGILEKDYNDAIHINGDIDERIFVNELNNLVGTDNASGDFMVKRGVKRKLDMVSSTERTITSAISVWECHCRGSFTKDGCYSCKHSDNHCKLASNFYCTTSI